MNKTRSNLIMTLQIKIIIRKNKKCHILLKNKKNYKNKEKMKKNKL
jgi:hypothetical protein